MSGHDHHSGPIGAISAVLGYFIGIESKIIPDAPHFWQAVITAIGCATAGWVTGEILKFCKPILKVKINRLLKLKSKK